MDDASWAALALSLTVLGGIWTWFSFRRRGISSGLRALAFTLLPVAAYLTKTLRLFTDIVGAVTDWAGRLVFNPTTWLGIVVAGVAALLFVVSGRLRAREQRSGQRSGQPSGQGARGLPGGGADPKPRSTGAGKGGAKGRPAVAEDDDMAEIEALLRKRGIS